ncbi:hypothetical protein HYH03_008873 [Edaphochlamys debaryana]|uniref:Uncharacterized protein n=1 Tax=Edaphochlamys debaryana TaxID=47281 RepID=A0A835Y2M2_9CHLO|nr:hypothetical protein HYH03_008873 [Edaphochlamys debaryana]|eukprot:KAG2492966.1 hypothetical protein HYH03_008873 [Edaphochlamys debaryana]
MELESDLSEDEDEYFFHPSYEDHPLTRMKDDEDALAACVHPQTRQPAAALPAELTLGLLESRLLCVGGKALERTLPCVGGLEPTVRLLKELMGQLPEATAAEAAAVPPAKRSRRESNEPSQGDLDPDLELLQLVFQAALDMVEARGPGRAWDDKSADDEQIPRLISLLASPAGRRLWPQAGPAACAAWLDRQESIGQEGFAAALAEAAVAFSDPAFDAALVRLVERRVAREFGPCLRMALAAALSVGLQQAMAPLVVKAAADWPGRLSSVDGALVERLAAAAGSDGEPAWQEHAEAVAGVMREWKSLQVRAQARGLP